MVRRMFRRCSLARPLHRLALVSALLLVGGAARAASFADYLETLRPPAHERGVSDATFDAALAGLTPDPQVAALTKKQPEFNRPIGLYLASAVSQQRIVAGRRELEKARVTLAEIEKRYGVPASIVVAVWGVESNFGASPGSKDVIRSLATLAYIGYRTDYFSRELVTALAILQKGDIARTAMRGSWAGAMGQTQFMPSSFETFAVDFDGDGRRDIWRDLPDALASTANYLAKNGWQRGEPWGYEVVLPQGFDYAISRRSFPEWAGMGIRRADGGALPSAGQGIMFFPSGAAGPAFLATQNFAVLKTYNNSDAYALSVAHLADRMNGRAAFVSAWPKDEQPLPREARKDLQQKLVAMGYSVDDTEGRISFAMRDTIRLVQAKVGLRPDGNPDWALMKALGSASEAR
jgi:membrane-bound lytic murein transglycosylase B